MSIQHKTLCKKNLISGKAVEGVPVARLFYLPFLAVLHGPMAYEEDS